MLKIKGKVSKVSEKEISGWCFAPGDPTPLEVVLLLDGVEINRTWATQKIQGGIYKGRWIRFRFGMSTIWDHCAPGQKLSVKAGDNFLPFQGNEEFDVLPPVGEKSPDHITDLLEQGWIINKFGKVHQPRLSSPKWKKRTHDQFTTIFNTLQDEFGLECFALYGVCLGFAREGAMIAHDLDLDLGYLSNHTQPAKVRKEFEEISRHFISVNPVANPFSYKLQFPGYGISLTPAWFDETGQFNTTFGFVGADQPDAHLVRHDIVPAKLIPWFDDKSVSLPANPVRVARYLYGPYWMYPDTGWKWFPEYRDRPEIARAKLTDRTVRKLQKLKTSLWQQKERTGL